MRVPTKSEKWTTIQPLDDTPELSIVAHHDEATIELGVPDDRGVTVMVGFTVKEAEQLAKALLYATSTIELERNRKGRSK